MGPTDYNCYVNGDLLFSIEGVHFEVGRVTGILGRSGSGKSTLLKKLAGQAPYCIGAVPQGLTEATFTRTPQNFDLIPWKTAGENILFALRRFGQGALFSTHVKRFHCQDFLDQYPRTLSGGQRCRTSLAMTLAKPSSHLLLDEPFSGLDCLTKAELAEVIFGLTREGITIVFVSHDLPDIVKYADRVYVIRDQGVHLVDDGGDDYTLLQFLKGEV